MYVGKQLRVSTYAKAAEDRLVKKPALALVQTQPTLLDFYQWRTFNFNPQLKL